MSDTWDPMDCSSPGSSVHGILQARIPEWVAIRFFRGSSWPRDQTPVSRIAGRHFNLWATRASFLRTFKKIDTEAAVKVKKQKQKLQNCMEGSSVLLLSEALDITQSAHLFHKNDFTLGQAYQWLGKWYLLCIVKADSAKMRQWVPLTQTLSVVSTLLRSQWYKLLTFFSAWLEWIMTSWAILDCVAEFWHRPPKTGVIS